jgi:hypothetical protein
MWLSNSPWCLMWDAYCNVLTARPVATKLATGMVGTFLGDLLAQFTQGLVRTHNAAAATIRGRSSRASGSGSTAAVGTSGSDAGGAFELDLARTARLVAFSALVGTPVAFVWFNLLDQVRAVVAQHACSALHSQLRSRDLWHIFMVAAAFSYGVPAACFSISS